MENEIVVEWKVDIFTPKIYNVKCVNSNSTNDVKEFIDVLIETASYPRSRRSNLNQVNVFGSARQLESSTDDKYCQFSAQLIRTYRGRDNSFCRPFSYHIVCGYEEPFDELEVVRDNFDNIKYKLTEKEVEKRRINIDGKLLALESVFS